VDLHEPRRPATPREAKALRHPLRLRILRLCGQRDLTNKQLAERLGQDPGTTLHHVRQLVAAGLLDQLEVRTGSSGALEKPYRSSGRSWWLSQVRDPDDPVAMLAPIQAFQEELSEAGPQSLQTFARFTLHLSAAEVEELDRRILEILDDYIRTDHERLDRPALGGLVALHRLAE
jgi:DNA-binding transcriptional ArsR family regulator